MCRHPPRSTRPAPPFPYTPRFRSPERRKPLAGLKGAAQLLARRADNRVGNEEERELIALIGSEVDRLAALLDRLLSPAPPRPHAPLNIHAVLERVLRLAESDAGWAVRLGPAYVPGLPEPPGDRKGVLLGTRVS